MRPDSDRGVDDGRPGEILTYHVVPGKMDATMLMEQAKMHGGMQALKAVGGGTLTVVMDGMKPALKDERGGMATITIPHVMQSNGVIYVISSVAMPK